MKTKFLQSIVNLLRDILKNYCIKIKIIHLIKILSKKGRLSCNSALGRVGLFLKLKSGVTSTTIIKLTHYFTSRTYKCSKSSKSQLLPRYKVIIIKVYKYKNRIFGFRKTILLCFWRSSVIKMQFYYRKLG